MNFNQVDFYRKGYANLKERKKKLKKRSILCEAVEVSVRWDDIKMYTPIKREYFFEAISFCIKNSYFMYDGKYYAQITGLAMGNPLSGIISEIVMDKLFSKIKEKFSSSIKIMVKYVDDSFFIMHNDIFNDVLSELNSFHNLLKFTYEKNANDINFLDISIKRNHDNSILLKHYKKPTYTGRIIHHLSNQPFHYKLNTAVNLKNNWLDLSSPIFHKEIINEIKILLSDNGYPQRFINLVLNQKKNLANVQKEKKKFYSLPYIGQSSIIISRNLSKLNNEIGIAFKNWNTLNNTLFSNIKDPTPLKKSELIYRVPCSDCPLSYVGETLQYLSARVNQHKRDERTQNDNTALAAHSKDKNHKFNFEKVEILAYENNTKKRKIREFIEIVKYDTVNFKKDTDKLGSTYNAIIKGK